MLIEARFWIVTKSGSLEIKSFCSFALLIFLLHNVFKVLILWPNQDGFKSSHSSKSFALIKTTSSLPLIRLHHKFFFILSFHLLHQKSSYED